MPTTYAIPNGAQYMAATTYTGNSSTQSVTNSGSMQPDFVWIKSRSNANRHTLWDAVRGVTARLSSNETAAEVVAADGFASFNSSGFGLDNTGSGGDVNVSGRTYVGWQWKANGSAVTNTSGSITSQVNAGTTQGFSVVTWTGTGANATVGHGLGVAPKMIIVKSRSAVENWPVYHASMNATPASGRLILDGTDAFTASSTTWNSAAPTSSVFSIGTATAVNTNAATYVAYCWSEVAGYSKFGSYTGNGSADGPFVYCGFRPRFIMFKDVSGSWDWVIFDTSRYTYNAMNNALRPNTSGAEDSTWTNAVDVLSNGFKLRNNFGSLNTSGDTIIYAAFAENPFKYANAR